MSCTVDVFLFDESLAGRPPSVVLLPQDDLLKQLKGWVILARRYRTDEPAS